MRKSFLAPCLIFVCTFFSAPSLAQQTVCQPQVQDVPSIDGIVVTAIDNDEEPLGMLRVEASNGAHMYIYFDKALEDVARSRAVCLGYQLNLLQEELGDDRLDAQWDSVVFTNDENYKPPRGKGIQTRWVIDPNPKNSASDDVLNVIPHEQVHGFQDRNRAGLPRWISEGHASWVAQRILARLHPPTERVSRERHMANLATATGPLDLGSWGSIRPKREAFLRQASDQDRLRMEEDPDYIPEGSYTFTTDDLEGDESNTPARYAGAFLVFEGLEARHGNVAVNAWVRSLTQSPERVTSEMVEKSVRDHFGEELSVLLSDD